LSSHSEGFDALVSSKKFYSSNPAHFSSSSSSSVQTSQSVDEIFQKILQLDTIEVHLLTELVNEKLGVAPLTPAQRAAMAQGGGGSSQAAVEEKEEEKTAFDLQLTGFDAKSKIKVIKEIRTITGLGLKDAKEMVEGAPKVVKKDIKMEEAEELKAKLEAVGGTVEIS
jgi:large subunit ribosomal protein L7/L12